MPIPRVLVKEFKYSSKKACWLKSPFEEEEIRKVVISLRREKGPGLDGFAFALLRCFPNSSLMVKLKFA